MNERRYSVESAPRWRDNDICRRDGDSIPPAKMLHHVPIRELLARHPLLEEVEVL